MMSFAPTPGPRRPSTRTFVRLRIALEKRLGGEPPSSTSLVPIPNAKRAERTVGPRVWLSPQTMSSCPAGSKTKLRPDHVDDPLRVPTPGVERDARTGLQLSVSCVIWAAAIWSTIGRPRGVVAWNGPRSPPSDPGAARADARRAGR